VSGNCRKEWKTASGGSLRRRGYHRGAGDTDRGTATTSLKETALIAVIGSQKIHNLGYFYALIPGAVGPVIMLAVALLVNNIPKNRRYPEFWL
jgi:hypothetical protein